MGGRGQASGKTALNEATEHYHSGEGMWINQYLRGEEGFGALSDNEKRYLKDLDDATRGKLKDKTLYRSVDASAIFGDVSEVDFENLSQVLSAGAQSLGSGAYADKARAKVNSIINGAVGATKTEKGFMSTTSDINIAEEFGGFTGAERPVVMKITTNGKARGANLSQYDKNASTPQKERLLARNTKYKINGVTGQNGRIVVNVTLE